MCVCVCVGGDESPMATIINSKIGQGKKTKTKDIFKKKEIRESQTGRNVLELMQSGLYLQCNEIYCTK